MALPLRLRVSKEWRGPLADPAEGLNVEVFSLALKHFAQEVVGASKDRRILLVIDQAGWHTGKEVEIPEGIHLEFLPSHSPELQPTERLWPLTNEAVANRLFESLDELEKVLYRALRSIVRASRDDPEPYELPLVAGCSVAAGSIYPESVLHPRFLQ